MGIIIIHWENNFERKLLHVHFVNNKRHCTEKVYFYSTAAFETLVNYQDLFL